MERPPSYNEKGKQNSNKFEKFQSNEEGYKPQYKKDNNRDFQKNKYNNNRYNS